MGMDYEMFQDRVPGKDRARSNYLAAATEAAAAYLRAVNIRSSPEEYLRVQAADLFKEVERLFAKAKAAEAELNQGEKK